MFKVFIVDYSDRNTMTLDKISIKRWTVMMGIAVTMIILMIPLTGPCFVASRLDMPSRVGKDTVHYIPHAPIYIEGNENFTAANGVIGGNGTVDNPYIFEGWDIDASTAAWPLGSGIEIANTNNHFIIRKCCVHDGDKNDSNREGICFVNATYGVIRDCEIVRNDNGITLRSYGGTPSTQNTVTNCTVSYNGIGIYLHVSHHNDITGCSISENRDGVMLLYSNFNNISHCLVVNNSDAGVYMGNPVRGQGKSMAFLETRTRFNVVYNCAFSGNARGIEMVRGPAENMILNCGIAGSGYCGIVLSNQVHNNTITGCTIQENKRGIYVSRSYYSGVSNDNLIYCNAFIGNHLHGVDTCDNRWDNGSVGNYWSTYRWFDLNRDGIGDLPKYIPGGLNWDRYPIMQGR